MAAIALQYLSRLEWYALIGSLVMSTLLTELIKRTVRHYFTWNYGAALNALLGFAIAAVATYSVWPIDGVFQHPLFAAILMGTVAPTLYKVTTAALRNFGYGWLADAITGERRKANVPPPGNIERRRP